MKIRAIEANNRRKAFVVSTAGGEYSFPFVKLQLKPTAADPVAEVYPDAELGNEAFTYRLASGAEDTVHLDSVREVAADPAYLQEVLIRRLTVEALRGVDESGLGKREISRQLGTSASQLYRLLDPQNPNKSIGQLLAVLHLVDREVTVTVTGHVAEGAPRRATGTRAAKGSALSQRHGKGRSSGRRR